MHPIQHKKLYKALVSAMTRCTSVLKLTTGALVSRTAALREPHGTVLLAEDNHANQKLAVVQIQKLGYQVKPVVNGREAVETILGELDQYIMVLMDCHMPEIDGFTATRLIRRAESTSGQHVPIIAMIASAMQADREQCLSAGMDDYITKPVNLEVLRKTLSRWATSTLHPASSHEENVAAEPLSLSIDKKVLDMIREIQPADEPNFLADLIESFFETTRHNLANICNAIDKSDPVALRFSAHSLKGSCANLGARLMMAYAYEMEALGCSGTLDGAESLYQMITEEYARVQAALNAECSTQA